MRVFNIAPNYVKGRQLLFFPFFRKDVVSLSDGLFANVLPIWEEICWSNHTNCFVFEEGALYRSISWNRLESSTQSMCKGWSNCCVGLFKPKLVMSLDSALQLSLKKLGKTLMQVKKFSILCSLKIFPSFNPSPWVILRWSLNFLLWVPWQFDLWI